MHRATWESCSLGAHSVTWVLQGLLPHTFDVKCIPPPNNDVLSHLWGLKYKNTIATNVSECLWCQRNPDVTFRRTVIMFHFSVGSLMKVQELSSSEQHVSNVLPLMTCGPRAPLNATHTRGFPAGCFIFSAINCLQMATSLPSITAPWLLSAAERKDRNTETSSFTDLWYRCPSD